MERSWLDTVQLLGLDMIVAVVVLALVISAAVRLLTGLADLMRQIARLKPRIESDSPGDPFAPQEWRPGW